MDEQELSWEQLSELLGGSNEVEIEVACPSKGPKNQDCILNSVHFDPKINAISPTHTDGKNHWIEVAERFDDFAARFGIVDELQKQELYLYYLNALTGEDLSTLGGL